MYYRYDVRSKKNNGTKSYISLITTSLVDRTSISVH